MDVMNVGYQFQVDDTSTKKSGKGVAGTSGI